MSPGKDETRVCGYNIIYSKYISLNGLASFFSLPRYDLQSCAIEDILQFLHFVQVE